MVFRFCSFALLFYSLQDIVSVVIVTVVVVDVVIIVVVASCVPAMFCCNGNDVMKSLAANPKLCGCFPVRGTAEFLINIVISSKVVLAQY